MQRAPGEWRQEPQRRIDTSKIERKLAAILIADVAGYSRLMGADEVRTLSALMADLKQVVDPEIATHRGRLVKSLGDGFLAEFPSAVDAVACAVAIQRAMLGRNARLPEDQRLLFRAGINVGDIIVEGTDIFGDGVNVAARLEALAEPGGLCISGSAHEQVRDRLPFAFADRGEQTVKNIARPVHVFALGAAAVAALGEVAASPPVAGPRERRRVSPRPIFVLAGLAAIAIAAAVWVAFAPFKERQHASTAPRFSMVVLPFASLGGEPGQDYLADIITEELTTGLSRLNGSFVIARSTAFTYKGKPVDVKQLGKDLDVRYVLEGSEQHSGNRVRVNAQLISAETGAHLWAEQFDADKSDMLQMQDEIVTRLARTLQLQLVEIEAARLARAHPGDPSAEDLGMRCEATLINAKPGSSETKTGLELCERALAIDPHNVRAQISLAFKYIDRVLAVQSSDREGDIRKAEDFVSRALAVDPNAPEAHLAKSELLLTQKRFEEAVVEADRSLVLNPSFVSAYNGLSTAYSFLGQPEKSLDYAEKAMRLSPRDPFLFVFQFEKGFALSMLKRDDEAIDWLSRSAAAAPEWPIPQAMLASLLALTGRLAESQAALQRYLSLPATTAKTIAQWKEGMPSGSPVFLAYADRLANGLRKAGMPEE